MDIRLKEIKKIIEGIRLKEIKKIIEGGAESMPFVSWYFVQKVGHGHNHE